MPGPSGSETSKIRGVFVLRSADAGAATWAAVSAESDGIPAVPAGLGKTLPFVTGTTTRLHHASTWWKFVVREWVWPGRGTRPRPGTSIVAEGSEHVATVAGAHISRIPQTAGLHPGAFESFAGPLHGTTTGKSWGVAFAAGKTFGVTPIAAGPAIGSRPWVGLFALNVPTSFPGREIVLTIDPLGNAGVRSASRSRRWGAGCGASRSAPTGMFVVRLAPEALGTAIRQAIANVAITLAIANPTVRFLGLVI
ncbi:MAG: hypothetical protein L3K16_08155 [Thermoplasmata archaeon]|nr:hypothetical protein [Thermoplasmata archaeon]